MVILRTVIEEYRVSNAIDEEGSIYPRLEAAYDALKWWLSHRPESGELINDIHWAYKQKGDVEANIPALVVIYTFDKNEVVLLSILVKLPAL